MVGGADPGAQSRKRRAALSGIGVSARQGGMHYTHNRNELGRIFAERFVGQMVERHFADGRPFPRLADILELWPAFLDCCASLDVIDFDARDEWQDSPPRGDVLEQLAFYFGA